VSCRLLVAAVVALGVLSACTPYRPASEVIEMSPAATDAPPLHFPDPDPTKTPVQREAFNADLTALGIPTESHLALELWGRTICRLNAQTAANGATVYDDDVVKRLPTDVANAGVQLTAHQAEAVWESTKRHICR
jgi:hypothetical protein